MIVGKGLKDGYLTQEEMSVMIAEGLEALKLDGKRVIVITPDQTRTLPLPFLFRQLYRHLAGRVKRQTYLIALGTHPQLNDEAINRLFGVTSSQRADEFKDAEIFNHEWRNQDMLARLGSIPAAEIEELSEGLMREDVAVDCNKRIFDYDHIIIIGPTFPHEVVGFSGGNKYFFPGISGAEVLNFFHWLGAVITNVKINGTKYTPVRKVIDHAAAMIGRAKACFSLVTTPQGVRGMYLGSPEEAWERAADLSAATQIVYKQRPFKSVLSVAPHMYEDLWTGGKCMYKLEPVVADNGELIIYAPHIREVSYTHGEALESIGYHCRDYFLKQMDRFAGVERALLAHSTHVKGLGRYENGVERPRINVVLATGMQEERCRRINLGYRDPASIRLEEWRDREDEGVLYVPRAGEFLYRLADGSIPTVD